MALTIQTEILCQEASSVYTYSYLYEPLRVVLSESNLAATKFYVDLEVLDTTNDTIQIEEILKYAEFDINPGKTLSFDLMKIAQQYHDANVFKISKVDDVVSGWDSVVSKYKYNFKIYSDVSARQFIKKIPLLGVRILPDFNPTVLSTTPINEFEVYGINEITLLNNWSGNYRVNTTLANPTLQDAKPTMLKFTGTGNEPCGGWLIWKSILGGWMFWGFDIRSKSFKKSYVGGLAVGMFESTLDVGGQAYTPVNYTGTTNSYSITMKSLRLSSNELAAVAGIQFSPAVYYSEPGSQKMELMKLTSSTTPQENLASGGDFSVTLQSISNTGMNTK